MKGIPGSLVKTWLFMIQSDDPKLVTQKFYAYQKIKQLFGSINMAEIYLEQYEDDEIEVMVI
ncbi:MAG: hypothetical protein HRT52_17200 [Colwellia sp.]|nr:hypothetical protein [Colwellia sp.]